ncbi:MAG TPA: class I SAM-dependent methyltransferase [Nitrospirota bacterium]|nr:class I SAM-dependent methyltransferase [Nitrospirota bacterium]
MEHAGTYRGEEVRSGSAFVEERAKRYAELLGAKTVQYVDQLRDFEVKCSRPGADEEILFEELSTLNDSMLQACAQFEQDVDDTFAIRSAQVDFREKTNPILSQSYGINRARIWPQGHQGDYNILEMAYKNSPMSDGMGYYLDKYMMSTEITVGVRERIVKLRELLRKELINRRETKVLDVACGSCREVFELAPEIKASGAKFTCVDLDADALNFALDRFEHAGLSEDHVELRKYNALRIFDYETAVTEFGMQDIIYSVGYFDYLPDDFLVKLLRSLYKMLTPGGKLIAAFKEVNRYRPQFFHWMVNWDGFLQRTEDDFERLLRLANIPESAISISRVASGVIIFYTVTKE